MRSQLCSLVRRAAATAAAPSASLAAKYSVRSFSSSSASEYLVVNAVGKDRTGIVSEMTKIVTDAGGNVGDSQAAKLGSHFSLMMHVSVPGGKSDELQGALGNMDGMSVTCFADVDPNAVEVTPKIGYSGAFSLSGADNPGIVHQLTSVLARNGLGIYNMHTSQEEAPFGGSTLFKVSGVANAPEPLSANFDPEAIREELEKLGEELNCDVTLEDVA